MTENRANQKMTRSETAANLLDGDEPIVMSRWTLYPLLRGLGVFAEGWDDLNARDFGNHPMLSSDFVNGLLRQFGTGSEYLCVARISGQVRAMCILRTRNRVVWTSFLPSQCQLGLTLISDGKLTKELIHALPWPAVQLDLLCNDPDVGQVLQRQNHSIHVLNHALTMSISLKGTYSDYWASRTKKLQSNVKRYLQRCDADGLAPRFVYITDAILIPAAINRYAVLEGAGWKGLQGTALGSADAQRQFYLDLLSESASRGEAMVHELWFGDTLASSRLMLVKDKTLVSLKTTHSEPLARYAPGRLLLRAAIESAFSSHPGSTLEFYTDANPDQLTWATSSRWIQHATVFRGQLVELFSTVFRPLLPLLLSPGIPRSGHGAETSEDIDVGIFNHPDQLPVAAQALLAQAEVRNVEFGVTWFQNLVKTVYPNDTGLRFYVLHQGKSVLAVLPIRAEKLRFGWRLESLGNYYTALYEPALAVDLKPHQLTPLLRAIRNDFPGVRSFRLSPMDVASHGYQTLIAAFRQSGWLPFEFFAFGNWYLPIDVSWSNYLAGRSSSMRSTIKRMTKKFVENGGTLQLVTDAKDVSFAISAYEKVYASSWKKPEPYPDFSPGLLTTCASKGWLRLGLAWLNGQPIAAQLWIVSNGRAEIYKVAYDENFKAFSPGTLVSAMLMQHVFEKDKVHEVDYLIGDDPYKKTWMTHRRERWGIVAYNPMTLGGMLGLMREMLGRWVKPRLVKFKAILRKPDSAI